LYNKETTPRHLAEVVILVSCAERVLGLNLALIAVYSDMYFVVNLIISRVMPSGIIAEVLTLLYIYYFSIILQFHVIVLGCSLR